MHAPTPEQQSAIDLFATGDDLVIEAGAGTGKTSTLQFLANSSPDRRGQYIAFNKALRGDQPVATPDGWREIGSLAVSDLVFGVDGLPHAVTKVIDRGERPMWRVAFSDDTEVVADDDHLWTIERSHSQNTSYVIGETVTTAAVRDHLERGRSVRVPQQATIDLPDVDLLIDPWVLGVLLGDGNLMHGRACLTNLDAWIFEEVARRLPIGMTVRFVNTPGKRVRTAALVADRKKNPLLDRLRLIGVYGLTAGSKFVPDEYLWAGTAQRLALLRGLMDTDGSTGAGNVTPIFTSTSEALADAVVFLTQSLGGAATKRTMREAVGPWARAMQVTVRLPGTVSAFLCPSKTAKLRDRTHDRLLRRRIVAITPELPASAVCISVDAEDRLFLTAGLVPTHNSIVVEASSKFPGSVNCSTAHSLAYRAVGHQYGARLRTSQRMRSHDIARVLGLDPLVVTASAGRKVLAAGFLAGLANRAIERFCQTADPVPNASHVAYIDGIDLPAADGHRTYVNNNEVARVVGAVLPRMWADLTSVTGSLPYKHSHYLKLWQLQGPVIPADYILFDEAQDANPLLMAVVLAQPDAQVVWVGDSQQEIYEWNGAVNAMASVPDAARTFLSQSFRFGPAVASLANKVLAWLDAELHLVGSPDVSSVVGPVADADVLLTRTNAKAVDAVLTYQRQGRRVHLVGGGAEIVRFAKAAQELMDRGKCFHPELACFDSWAEVEDYVRVDQSGGELRMLVNLVEEYGVPTILQALDHMPSEANADVVVSTSHKAKGREWDSVALGGDLASVKDGDSLPSEPELRLLYVAATRARRELDPSAVSLLCPDEVA